MQSGHYIYLESNYFAATRDAFLSKYRDDV